VAAGEKENPYESLEEGGSKKESEGIKEVKTEKFHLYSYGGKGGMRRVRGEKKEPSEKDIAAGWGEDSKSEASRIARIINGYLGLLD